MQTLNNNFKDNTIPTYNKCSCCLNCMPERHDKWCSDICYDNLLAIYNMTYNKPKKDENTIQK